MKRDEAMPNSEFGLLVAYLGRQGVVAQVAREVLGNSPQDRTRGEIADTLKAWMKTLPKAD